MIDPPARSRAANLAWTSTTYFGEGLPWSFLHQMATEYLTAIRAPVQQVGYTSLLHGATTLKFVWGPLVDLFGTKRSWMVVLQVVLGLGMIGVAAVSTSGSLSLFWLALVVLAIIHATHDIACDGYYMLALRRSDQALYSGVRVAAFRVAMIVGSSWLVYLAGKTSWPVGFTAAGVIMMMVGAGNALFIPRVAEPHVSGIGGSTPTQRHGREYLAAYQSFFAQPQAVLVLAFMFCFKLGDILTFAMSRPLLRDIGISTAQRGLIATPQMLAHIGGAMVAGALIARYGLKRCLTPMTYFMALPLYILLAWVKPSIEWVVVVVVAEQFAGGLGSTASVVFLMNRSRRMFSASHYAFASGVVALGSMLIGAISGHLNASLGHRWYFVVCFLFSVPSLILVLFVPKQDIDEQTKPAAG